MKFKYSIISSDNFYFLLLAKKMKSTILASQIGHGTYCSTAFGRSPTSSWEHYLQCEAWWWGHHVKSYWCYVGLSKFCRDFLVWIDTLAVQPSCYQISLHLVHFLNKIRKNCPKKYVSSFLAKPHRSFIMNSGKKYAWYISKSSGKVSGVF